MEEQKRRRERKSAAYWLSKSSILYPICILYGVFADKLPLKMRKFAFSINLGIAKLSFETTRERKD